jgi:hypothetical protein
MAETSGRLGFQKKLFARLARYALGYLEGNLALDVGIAGQVDHTGSPLAQFADNFVPAHALAVHQTGYEFFVYGGFGHVSFPLLLHGAIVIFAQILYFTIIYDQSTPY